MSEIKTQLQPSGKSIRIDLSVLDRHYLSSLMPDHGSIAEIELGEAILHRIGFTPEEEQEFEIEYLADGRLVHNPGKAKSREFHFESYELLFIQQGIREHENTKMIRPWNKDLAKRLLAITVN